MSPPFDNPYYPLVEIALSERTLFAPAIAQVDPPHCESCAKRCIIFCRLEFTRFAAISGHHISVDEIVSSQTARNRVGKMAFCKAGAQVAQIRLRPGTLLGIVRAMEPNSSPQLGFFARLGLAWKLLFHGEFARGVQVGLQLLEASKTPPPAPLPHQVHASALFMLGALQREGRLIDFLQQDLSAHSDADIGAAARVVHGGCRKTLQQYLDLQPAMKEAEGASVAVAKGFDPQRIQLTGNVSGQPPFRGVLKHHGWVTSQIRLPVISEALDARVLAPAEVELT
jgi:hypothetical protein